jgi:hypothetical protein
MNLMLLDEECGAMDFVVKQPQQAKRVIIHDRPSMAAPALTKRALIR